MDTKGHCFPKSIIIQAVYLKLRFTLSYRDVEEIMRIRGVEVDHATIQRWVFKFMPEIEIQMRKRKKVVGKRWRMDETYSVPGSLRYLVPPWHEFIWNMLTCIYAWLCRHMSLSDSDSSCTDEVMKLADKGKWGEFVKPRCFSRLNIGRMKNMNRLNRVYGLKRRHYLHELTGSIMWSPVTCRNMETDLLEWNVCVTVMI